MKTVLLLPWSPESDPRPEKQAVVEVWVHGDAVRIGVSPYADGHTLYGGRLTPCEAEGVAELLVKAAAVAREKASASSSEADPFPSASEGPGDGSRAARR